MVGSADRIAGVYLAELDGQLDELFFERCTTYFRGNGLRVGRSSPLVAGLIKQRLSLVRRIKWSWPCLFWS